MGCGCSSSNADESSDSPKRSKRRDRSYRATRPGKKPAKLIKDDEKPRIQKYKEKYEDKENNAVQFSGAKLSKEEIAERRKKIAESAESRRSKEAKRGLSKFGQIEMQILEKKKKQIEAYEKNHPRDEHFGLRYKK